MNDKNITSDSFQKFKNLNLSKLEDLLDTNFQNGLSDQEADARLDKYGRNTLPEKPLPGYLQIFILQFKSPLIYLLVIAGIIAGVVHNLSDTIIILAVVIINAVIGAIQEGRASATLASLKKFLVRECTIIRDGKKKVIDSKNLVVGDIIVLKSGERVPADSRIIESANLKIDEAILTGESGPVQKKEDDFQGNRPIYEQTNMLFSGTYVLWGNAKAVVVGTGIDTQIGKIHKAIEEIETETPLKKQIANLSYYLVIIGLAGWAVLFLGGLLLGVNISQLFVVLTALLVSIVPEGLPIVVTVVLATGAYTMARKNVLIKKLQAVEGLSRIDVIVTDKTGTLTRNEMKIEKIFAGGREYKVTGQGYYSEGQVLYEDQPINFYNNQHSNYLTDKNFELYYLTLGGALISKTFINYDEKTKLFKIKGEPLEAAVQVLAHKLCFDKDVLKEYKRIAEMPFDVELRYQISAFEKGEQIFIFAMGSPEVLLDIVKDVKKSDHEALDKYLDQGLRLIGLAYKIIDKSKWQHNNVNQEEKLQSYLPQLAFVGICGIQDAIRPGVASVVKEARSSGLNIVMATGDHLETAKYVATEVDILRAGDISMTGLEFEQMSDAQILKILEKITVFARFSPMDKQRLVGLYHKQNKLVAMTGDGVNDSPSLVAADIGIAMGIQGSEVAQQASDLILLDDSFTSIVKAIEVGRHIFYALRRVIFYLFATNFSEVVVVILGFIFFSHENLPLVPAQILWLNLVTDGFLDIAVGLEPMQKDILTNRSLAKLQKGGLIDKRLTFKIIYMGLYMGLGSLFVFYLYKNKLTYARSMTLLIMAMFQWFNAWNARDENKSIFTLGLTTNKWLLGAMAIVLLLQIFAIYVPFMNIVLSTVPLGLKDWVLAILIASTLVIVEELRKFIANKSLSSNT